MPKVDFERLEDPDFYDGDEPLDILSSALNLCGCGSDKPVELLYECLLWAAMGGPNQKGWEKGFYRDVGAELAAKLLDSYGLLEHGTGIGWAWITEDGKRLLNLIELRKQEEKERR